jgi:predicted nucleic acid-binding protein
MIFVDTGSWFAAAVPTDPSHHAASLWLAGNTEPLLTTDYVVDETLTLLRARGERARSLLVGEAFFAGRLAKIYTLDEADVALAWETFRCYDDKEWSFTDCASKVVIERLNVR